MSSTSRSRIARQRLLALALPAALALPTVQSAHAADGTWTSTTSGGLWSNTSNWSGGTVADGSASTAFFNTLDITAATTVNLDSARTIGALVFGDTATATAGSWILANNGNAANILTLGGAATISVNAMAAANNTGSNATISSVIAGVNGLTFNSTGVNSIVSTTNNTQSTGLLTLSGANTYTGATNINAGTLRVTNASAFGGVAGDKLTSNMVNVSNGARLTLSAVNIANTVNLNGNTASPTVSALAVTGGSSTLSGIVNVQSNALAYVHNGGNYTLTFSGALNLGANVLTLQTTGDNNGALITGTVTGTGGITKNGAGPLTMSGNGSGYSGTTLFNSGELRLGSDTALGTGTLTLNPSNNTLVTIRSTAADTTRVVAPVVTLGSGISSRYAFGSITTATGNLTFTNTTGVNLAGQKLFEVHNKTQFDAGFSGSGGITMQTTANLGTGGTGTLVLNGASSYTGNTTINAGTFQLGAGGTTGSLSTSSAISVASGATFAFNRSNRVVQGTDFRSGITGAGGVSHLGSGTTVLAGNAFTGAINAGAGTLLINGDNSSASGVAVASGARLGGLNGTVGAVTFGSGAGLAYDLVDASQTGGLVTSSFAGGGVGSFTVFLTGAGTNFNDTQTYSWEVLRSDATSIAALATSSITIDTSGFGQAFGGNFTWSTDTDSLFLNYTASAIPEPNTAVLLVGGIILGFASSRRRRVRF